MAEKNDKNRIADFSKRALSLRSGLVYGLFALLLAAALTGGLTSAWFTSGANTENTFTAGILDIEATGPYYFDGNNYSQEKIDIDIVFDPCAILSYLIKNNGTKTAYVRAKFEGHWLRGFHENKASAAVNYNGDPISANDFAHFNYPSEIQPEPVYTAERPDDAVGFTDQLLLGPVQFEPLPLQYGASESKYYNISGSPIFESFASGQDEIIAPITAPGENFSFKASSLADLADGLLYDLFGVGPSCTSLREFKLPYQDGDLDNEDIAVGKSITLTQGDFSITITKNQGETFNFVSNNPKYLIYHMFVKGGAQGSNLYTYYVNNNKVIPDGNLNYVSTAFVESKYTLTNSNPFLPGIDWTSLQYDKIKQRVYIDLDNLSISGVNAGVGLDAATGFGWSHITVYYCEAQIVPDPDLELVKLVKVEENGLWYTSKEYEDTAIIDALKDNGYDNIGFYNYLDDSTWRDATIDYVPQFKIVVANTGNVALNQIQVSDDYFAGINQEIGVLEPGQLWISEVIEYTGYLDPLSTEAISIKIDPLSQNDWIPPGPQDLGEYFYYNKIIVANSNLEIPLHIQVCLDDGSLNKKYSGAVFKLYAFFEAVQTTNGLVDNNWQDKPF